MSEEIKPCGRCGGAPEATVRPSHIHGNVYRIGCKVCGIEASGYSAEWAADAWKAHNTPLALAFKAGSAKP